MRQAVCFTNTVARQQTVEFILRGKLEGVDITPQSIGLHLFNQFNTEVEELIVGSQKGLKLTEAKARVEEGSYKLTVVLGAFLPPADGEYGPFLEGIRREMVERLRQLRGGAGVAA